MKKVIQIAGRDALEEFAPQLVHFNDDVLSGENWNDRDIGAKTRSTITVIALMTSGTADTSLEFHLQNAKRHGITQKEITAVITHAAFYAGWPKGQAVFTLAKEVRSVNEDDLSYEDVAMRVYVKDVMFPTGDPNDSFAKHFSGRSSPTPVSTPQVVICSTAFGPGYRSNWYIHHAKSDGG